MRRSLAFVVLALGVIALPWLVVSVTANMQPYAAPIPTRFNATCTVCHSNSTQSSVLSLTGQPNVASFQLVLAMIAVLFVGVCYLAWRRGVRSGKGDSLWNIPAMLLLVGMFYLFLTVYSRLGNLQIGSETVSLPLPLSYLALSLVVVAGGTSLIWALRRTGGMSVIPAPAVGEMDYQGSLAGVLQGAIASLRTGNDPRSAIIRCYQSMVEQLEKGGISDSPSMTAREFEAACQERFSVRRDLVHRLTNLFERARYSKEDLGSLHVDEAQEVLTELKNSLGEQVGTH